MSISEHITTSNGLKMTPKDVDYSRNLTETETIITETNGSNDQEKAVPSEHKSIFDPADIAQIEALRTNCLATDTAKLAEIRALEVSKMNIN